MVLTMYIGGYRSNPSTKAEVPCKLVECMTMTEFERHKVQRMLPRHFQILDMVMAGHNNEVIATTVDLHRDTIGYITRSPLFQAELTRRRKEDNTEEILGMDRDAIVGKARSILEQSVEAAAEKHVELLETEDPSLQMRAASQILDRVFGKAEEKSVRPVVSLTAENVQLLVLAMKESPNAQVNELPANGQTAEDPEA